MKNSPLFFCLFIFFSAFNISVSQTSSFCFSPATYNPLSPASTANLIIRDFNNDGSPDFLLDGPKVFLSNAGGYNPVTTYNYIYYGFLGDVGDFNNDGNFDAIMLNQWYDSLLIYKGTSTGVFSSVLSFSIPSFASSVVVSDLNNDGNDDIIVNSQNRLHIIQGNGAFTFTLNSSLSCNGVIHIVAEDLDNDGLKDIAAGNGNSIVWYKQLASGAFIQLPALVLGNYSYSQIVSREYFKVVDCNNDGLKDIVALGNGFEVIFGNGSFQFSNPVVFPVNDIKAFDAQDLNGDGLRELIAISISTCTIFEAQPGNSWISTNTFLIPYSGQVASHLGQIRTSDVNNDGLTDLVFAGFGNFPVQVYLNCQPVGIGDNINTSNNISLVPNPSRDKVDVFFENNLNREGILEISNQFGERVYCQKIYALSSRININLEHLSSGVYFVRFLQDKKVYCAKLIHNQ